jgi:predicted CopG family antitoxin
MSKGSTEILIYVWVPIHISPMASKNISITEEAYEALQREKTRNESFTDAILRLTRKRGKLSDCFGSWKMTDSEQAAIENDLAKGWRRAQERVSHEVS